MYECQQCGRSCSFRQEIGHWKRACVKVFESFYDRAKTFEYAIGRHLRLARMHAKCEKVNLCEGIIAVNECWWSFEIIKGEWMKIKSSDRKRRTMRHSDFSRARASRTRFKFWVSQCKRTLPKSWLREAHNTNSRQVLSQQGLRDRHEVVVRRPIDGVETSNRRHGAGVLSHGEEVDDARRRLECSNTRFFNHEHVELCVKAKAHTLLKKKFFSRIKEFNMHMVSENRGQYRSQFNMVCFYRRPL